MYVTILSGHVSHENWNPLKKSFAQVGRRPPLGLLQSVLVQSEDDPTLWQIISFWPSKEVFKEAERKEETNICVKLFCDAGSVPNRRGFPIVERYSRV
jgi:quinol monooxygenase YgiN